MVERISVCPDGDNVPSGADDVPSVNNENVAGRTGDTAPYFDNEMVTYVCADGYRTVPASTPIIATCTAGSDPANPGVWTGPANADTVCQPSKMLYIFLLLHLIFAKRAQNHNESSIDCRGFRLNKIVMSNNLCFTQ